MDIDLRVYGRVGEVVKVKRTDWRGSAHHTGLPLASCSGQPGQTATPKRRRLEALASQEEAAKVPIQGHDPESFRLAQPLPTPLWRIVCSSAEAFSGVHQELPALSICPEKVLINPPDSNWLADSCDGAFQPREIDVTGAEDPGPWWDSALIS